MTDDRRLEASESPGPPERIVDSRVLRRGRYLTFRVDTVERPDGSRTERDIAGHPGAVAVVAIDEDDRVLLVRQFRVATGGILLEIPAGTLEVAADGTTEDPDLAARRELEEETGQHAAEWRKLGMFWTAPGFATELMHLYLARGLTTVRDTLGEDEDEQLELERIPVADLLAMADRGEIRDAKTLVGLYWLWRLGLA
jgi:ADP-ribose pyrophosphatase